MFYRVVELDGQKPLARFTDEADALAYLRAYAAQAPDEAEKLALVRFGENGLAEEAWSLSDLQGSGGRLRIPEYH
jgi:hypothetical protein